MRESEKCVSSAANCSVRERCYNVSMYMQINYKVGGGGKAGKE